FLFLLRCSRFPSGPRCYFVSVRAPLPPPFPYTTLFRSLLASRARACSWRLLRKAGLDVILERAGVLIAPGEAHMVSGQEMYVQGVIAALAGRIGKKERDFLLLQSRFYLGSGPVLDPVDFQLLTDDLPAAGGSATICSCVSAPVVIDPIAVDGPIGMVVHVQRGPRCL